MLRRNKSKIIKDENGKNVPHLETTEVVLVRVEFVDNDYEQDSRLLYNFVHDKLFDQFLDISPTNFTFLKSFN